MLKSIVTIYYNLRVRSVNEKHIYKMYMVIYRYLQRKVCGIPRQFLYEV